MEIEETQYRRVGKPAPVSGQIESVGVSEENQQLEKGLLSDIESMESAHLTV